MRFLFVITCCIAFAYYTNGEESNISTKHLRGLSKEREYCSEHSYCPLNTHCCPSLRECCPNGFYCCPEVSLGLGGWACCQHKLEGNSGLNRKYFSDIQ
uniref:Cysteine rich secreted protein n=1 Tax=Riptortus pedestris TaxID=329032 RepID=R4WMP9_RIPPE|nr:cysteine rich secreted protein [Riptortus pedestris]